MLEQRNYNIHIILNFIRFIEHYTQAFFLLLITNILIICNISSSECTTFHSNSSLAGLLHCYKLYIMLQYTPLLEIGFFTLL